ncbi:MAG: ferrous iron transport protein A [Candidatus Hydrogenedentota bacterium]
MSTLADTGYTLSELRPGERGVVQHIAARESGRQRLLEMGFVPGATVETVRVSPLGDPMEVIVSGYHLAIRRQDARCISLRRPA